MHKFHKSRPTTHCQPSADPSITISVWPPVHCSYHSSTRPNRAGIRDTSAPNLSEWAHFRAPAVPRHPKAYASRHVYIYMKKSTILHKFGPSRPTTHCQPSADPSITISVWPPVHCSYHSSTRPNRAGIRDTSAPNLSEWAHFRAPAVPRHPKAYASRHVYIYMKKSTILHKFGPSRPTTHCQPSADPSNTISVWPPVQCS